VEPRAAYRHELRQVVTEAGTQNAAAISISLDPTYEKLVIHTITVRRGGVTANRLRREDVHLLRREGELDDFLYRGTHTA
jgi:hypothetical protein